MVPKSSGAAGRARTEFVSARYGTFAAAIVSLGEGEMDAAAAAQHPAHLASAGGSLMCKMENCDPLGGYGSADHFKASAR